MGRINGSCMLPRDAMPITRLRVFNFVDEDSLGIVHVRGRELAFHLISSMDDAGKHYSWLREVLI